MVQVMITDREGREHRLDGEEGLTLMEAIRDHGLDELLALCGGSCSCATCHVIVGSPWFAATGEIGEFEDALLDSSSHREPTSRLSCQISLAANLNGIHVRIAAED